MILNYYKNNTFLILVLSLFLSTSVFGQLDSVHYLPPIHEARGTIGQQVIYLSTPETTPFLVNVKLPDGTVAFSGMLSNATPLSYVVATSGNSDMHVENNNVGVVLSNFGYVVEGAKQFFCVFRFNDTIGIQAESLTCKGEAAKGNEFFIGGITNLRNTDQHNFVTSIMATEDNTVIQVSNYNTGVVFNSGTGAITADTLNITLNKFETYVIEGASNVVANRSGFVGAKVASNFPIVCNTGNLLGGWFTGNARDYCMDQIVPSNEVGKEYIMIKGDGDTTTEKVLVVATQPNTSVYVNGGVTPSVLVNEGDYVFLDGSNYTSGGTHSSMYILSDEPVYVYQYIAGSATAANKTPGMNFIPPLSCFLPKEVDKISEIEKVGTSSYTGNLILTTAAGSTVLVNGVAPSAASGPDPVDGTTGYVTYRINNVSGDYKVTSTGPLAVGVFGSSGDAGFAGYYSGFGELPNVSLSARNNQQWGVDCLPGVELYTDEIISNLTLQWYDSNGPLAGETNDTLVVPQEETYYLIVSSAFCFEQSSNLFVPNCTSLPVELLYADLTCQNTNYLLLRWATASEINNDFFILEGSRDAYNWEGIAQVNSLGNSSPSLFYEVEIKNNLQYYRLSQQDYDGNSQVLKVLVNKCDTYSSAKIYPNPFDDHINIQSDDNIYSIELLDESGRLLYAEDFNESNTKIINLNKKKLSRGFYLIKINKSVYKITKQ